MSNNTQSNSSSQVNTTRNTFNTNVSNLKMLGSSRRIQWDSKRRHRAI